MIALALAVTRLSGRGGLFTGYDQNGPIIGQEFGNTNLYAAGWLAPADRDCTLTQPSALSYDNAQMMMRLDAGSASTIMGYPQFAWGNPYTYGGVALTPRQVSAVATLWNRIKWSFTGTGRFNALFEHMLTDVAISPGVDGEKVVEMAVMLHMPETTKQFIYGAPYSNLGGIVDAYGRAWACAFKSGSGSSDLGYCIFYPADMDDRLDTEFDYAAMCNFAIPKIVGATTALYISGLSHGFEPMGSSGTNTVTRETWIRAFDNAPALSPTPVKENIFPNSRFLSDYGRMNDTTGFTISGNGKLAVNTPDQFNYQAFHCPLQSGVTYSVTWDQVVTTGSIRTDLVNAAANGVVNGTAKSGSGSQTQSLTATATTVGLRVTAGSANTAVDVSNLRCVPV